MAWSHNHCLGFLLGRLYYPAEIGNNGYAIFFLGGGGGGAGGVQYGLYESSEYQICHRFLSWTLGLVGKNPFRVRGW